MSDGAIEWVPQVKCRTCEGSGSVPLSLFAALFETFEVLGDDWMTTNAIHDAIVAGGTHIVHPAVNARLGDLHTLGLIERRDGSARSPRSGRARVYEWRRSPR